MERGTIGKGEGRRSGREREEQPGRERGHTAGEGEGRAGRGKQLRSLQPLRRGAGVRRSGSSPGEERDDRGGTEGGGRDEPPWPLRPSAPRPGGRAALSGNSRELHGRKKRFSHRQIFFFTLASKLDARASNLTRRPMESVETNGPVRSWHRVKMLTPRHLCENP